MFKGRALLVFKKTFFTVFFILTILAITSTSNSYVVHAIVKRNSPDYPVDKLNMSLTDLKQLLNELKKLNDTMVNKYVEEIENALEQGDYEKAEYYMRLLSNYLRKNYGGKGSSEIDKYVALLDSIKEISNESVVIDINDLIKKYKEIFKASGETQFSFEDIYNALSPHGASREFPETIGEAKGTSVNNVFNPPSPPAPTIPNIVFSLDWAILVGLTLAVMTIFYIYRRSVAGYLKPLKKYFETIKYSAITMLKPVKDPIINLYNKWYLNAKLYGYKRFKWETLREFLAKIHEDKLRGIGEKITRLYEDRIYGGAEIDEEIVETIRRELELG